MALIEVSPATKYLPSLHLSSFSTSVPARSPFAPVPLSPVSRRAVSCSHASRSLLASRLNLDVLQPKSTGLQLLYHPTDSFTSPPWPLPLSLRLQLLASSPGSSDGPPARLLRPVAARFSLLSIMQARLLAFGRSLSALSMVSKGWRVQAEPFLFEASRALLAHMVQLADLPAS